MDWDTITQAPNKIAASAGDEDVDSSPVPHGQIWEIREKCGEDATSTASSLRIGIVRANVFYPLTETKTLAAATLYFDRHPVWLREEEILRFRFNGATVGDKLNCQFNGRVWK